MASPEGPNRMTEEQTYGAPSEAQAPNTPAVPERRLTIVDRARNAMKPLAIATGLVFGGVLYSGPQEVAAREPIEEPASPAEANPDGIDYAHKAYVPLALTRQQPPVQTPIVEPTDEPIPTIRPEPSLTPTVPPTTEPSPTIPVIPTDTPTPTPTDTETVPPTEQGPLKELELKKGDLLIIGGNSPTLKYALVGTNGDQDSGAAAAGYDFASMQNPVLDRNGKYVVGTVIKDDEELTIRVPVESVEPQMRERIQTGNPEEDTRLGATVALWTGRGEREKTLVANALGGNGLGSFIGNYDTGADFHIQATASGTAKTGIIEFSTADRAAKRYRKFQLSSDLQGTWSIVNGEQDAETGAYSGPLTTLHTFTKDSSDLRFRIVGNQLVIPQGEGLPEKYTYIPYPLANGLTFAGSDRKGTAKSQALIKVQEASVRFLETTNDEPIGGPDFAVPTLADVAKKTKKRIMVEGRYFSQPADAAISRNITNIYDAFNAWGVQYPEAEQATYFDQDKPTAIILDVGMSDADILQIIANYQNPDSIFQYGPRATANGPVGSVFNQDGTLTNKRQLREILKALKKGGSVILNSNISPDMELARAIGAEQPTRLSPMSRALEDLKALGAGDETTLLLAGDSEYIDTTNLTLDQAVNALKYALETVQAAGINPGLGNIIGPGDQNITNDFRSNQFYELIGQSTVGLENVTLGFGSNLTPLTWGDGERMALTIRLGTNATEEQSFQLSSGAKKLTEIFRASVPKK